MYSLHTYDWRKPDPPTTLVASTAFIKELNAALDTLSPFTAPPVPRNPSQQGTPAVPLMRAALRQFEALSRVRSRCLSPPPLLKVRRHLIILALSSCQDLAPLEAEAVGDAMGSCDVDGATGGGDDDKLLSNLRSLRVAVSIFSPVEYNKNLRKLANIVNLLTPEIRKDPSWPTVIYSREYYLVSFWFCWFQMPVMVAVVAQWQGVRERPRRGDSGLQILGILHLSLKTVNVSSFTSKVILLSKVADVLGQLGGGVISSQLKGDCRVASLG